MTSTFPGTPIAPIDKNPIVSRVSVPACASPVELKLSIESLRTKLELSVQFDVLIMSMSTVCNHILILRCFNLRE